MDMKGLWDIADSIGGELKVDAKKFTCDFDKKLNVGGMSMYVPMVGVSSTTFADGGQAILIQSMGNLMLLIGTGMREDVKVSLFVIDKAKLVIKNTAGVMDAIRLPASVIALFNHAVVKEFAKKPNDTWMEVDA
jgi:hypothetical protein